MMLMVVAYYQQHTKGALTVDKKKNLPSVSRHMDRYRTYLSVDTGSLRFTGRQSKEFPNC
jgi:hypothetical protein